MNNVRFLYIRPTGYGQGYESGEQIELVFEICPKLTGIFDSARKTDDFGNGRYVRNLIENAHIEQCNRLAKKNVVDVTDDDIRTLAPEDIVAPNISPYDGNARRFGFAVRYGI